VGELVGEGKLEVRAGVVSRPGFVPRLTPEQEKAREALRALYRGAGIAPPFVEELPETIRGRGDLWPLLRLLENEGALTAVEHGLFMWTETLDDLAGQVTLKLGGRKDLGPADFREIMTVTRKHLMPLLAHFDSRGVTVRRGEGREVPRRPGTVSTGSRAPEVSDS
jgi:hypothetical protein